MATQPTTPRANLDPASRTPGPRMLWGRPLAVAAAVAFVISSAFPVTAGLSQHPESFPAWWGPLDVVLAFVLVILAFAIIALAGRNITRQAEDTSYRVYRVLLHGILVMIVVFFLAGDRIVWTYCLVGLAWRTWLLLYGLPAWLTAFNTMPDVRSVRGDPLPRQTDHATEG